MKNTLKIALMVIGLALIVYGIYALLTGQNPSEITDGIVQGSNFRTQALAMMAFGGLCLISGIAFKRRKK